jgi:hypothetical protein
MSFFSFLGNLFGGGGGGASRDAERLAQKQANDIRSDADIKAEKLRTGMANIDNAFAGFDDNYFAKLAKDYTDYAMPQLQSQYDDTKKNITFALARKGNLASTTAGDQYGMLDRQNAFNKTDIEGKGADYAAQQRAAIQANKQDIVGQLNTTYDADAANNLALSMSKSLQVPKTNFNPLGQMFTNISAVAAQAKQASDSNPGGYNPGARTYNPNNPGSYVWG